MMKELAEFKTDSYSLPKQMKSTVNIVINEQRWKQYNFPLIFANIQSWQIQYLQLSYPQTKITPSLFTISFLQLKSIAIFEHLQTIELIDKLHFPLLQQISLYYNKINRIKALRKVVWPHFRHISIQDNKIMEGRELSEVSFRGLSELHIQFMTNDGHQFFDSRFLLKLGVESLKELSLANSERIKQRSVQSRLLDIHKDLKIDPNINYY